jgi:hypothetical protein
MPLTLIQLISEQTMQPNGKAGLLHLQFRESR